MHRRTRPPDPYLDQDGPPSKDDRLDDDEDRHEFLDCALSALAEGILDSQLEVVVEAE